MLALAAWQLKFAGSRDSNCVGLIMTLMSGHLVNGEGCIAWWCFKARLIGTGILP